MIRCFFQADDFGLNSAVTRGIVSCMRQNRVQGTGIMPGGLYAAEAIRMLPRETNTHVSVHLNLLEGRSCAPAEELPDLTDASGCFCLTLGGLWKKLSAGSAKQKDVLLRQIFLEFCAQVEAVQQGTGCTDVRLDGHLHIHSMPALVPVMERIIRRYPVVYVRLPREELYAPALPLRRIPVAVLRRCLLARWSKPLGHMLRRHAVPSADYFIGVYASGGMTLPALCKGLERVRAAACKQNPLVEIMVHPADSADPADVGKARSQPGFYRQSAYTASHYSLNRVRELHMLLSPELPRALDRYGAVFAV